MDWLRCHFFARILLIGFLPKVVYKIIPFLFPIIFFILVVLLLIILVVLIVVVVLLVVILAEEETISLSQVVSEGALRVMIIDLIGRYWMHIFGGEWVDECEWDACKGGKFSDHI